MFSVAPNIVLAPNMTQNAERKHRTQDTNTAPIRPPIGITIVKTGMKDLRHKFSFNTQSRKSDNIVIANVDGLCEKTHYLNHSMIVWRQSSFPIWNISKQTRSQNYAKLDEVGKHKFCISSYTTSINKGLFTALGDQSYVTSCGVWFWVKPIANTVVSIIFRIWFCHAEIAHKRALD